MNAYDFCVKAQDGTDVALSQYCGKALLIVNTATACGFTPQYDQLQDLYEECQAAGLEILDFPCNQFGAQAPGSDDEIHSFCSDRYGITFPQFAKVDVNGENAIPLYQWLTSSCKFEGFGDTDTGRFMDDLLAKIDPDFRNNGASVRLKVEQSPKESIYNDGVYLYLHVKNPTDVEHSKRIVTRYLNQQCKTVFDEILREIYQPFQKYGVAFPVLRIREMDTRWGSCLAKKGIITLNKRLLEAPRSCIEYVVTHELCHCVHANHSRQFYLFLTMFMPDWQERKQQLDKYAEYWL